MRRLAKMFRRLYGPRPVMVRLVLDRKTLEP